MAAQPMKPASAVGGISRDYNNSCDERGRGEEATLNVVPGDESDHEEQAGEETTPSAKAVPPAAAASAASVAAEVATVPFTYVSVNRACTFCASRKTRCTGDGTNSCRYVCTVVEQKPSSVSRLTT